MIEAVSGDSSCLRSNSWFSGFTLTSGTLCTATDSAYQESEQMRIGELSKRTGASVRALRYYEEQNLLSALRSDSGQRRYTESAIDRVRLIQLLYAAGLSSRTILDLVPCIDTGTDNGESLGRLAEERDRINVQIDELIAARDHLNAIIEVVGDSHDSGEHQGACRPLAFPVSQVRGSVKLPARQARRRS
jgi:DNA-binding transcriptional MerR regulator